MLIHPAVRTMLFGMIAFIVPVGVAVAINWESARPYVYVTPDEARGYVLAFDARG